jgi:hypothetical protein
VPPALPPAQLIGPGPAISHRRLRRAAPGQDPGKPIPTSRTCSRRQESPKFARMSALTRLPLFT